MTEEASREQVLFTHQPKQEIIKYAEEELGYSLLMQKWTSEFNKSVESFCDVKTFL